MEDINLSTSSYLAMSDDDGGDSSSGQVQSFKEMASEVRSNDDDDDVGPKDDDELLGNPTSMIESVKAKQAEKAAGKKKTKQQPVKYSWTTEAVDALIREWEVRPNLFDSSHKEYHLKDHYNLVVHFWSKRKRHFKLANLSPLNEWNHVTSIGRKENWNPINWIVYTFLQY